MGRDKNNSFVTRVIGSSEENARLSVHAIYNHMDKFPGAKENNMLKNMYIQYGDKSDVHEDGDMPLNRRRKGKPQRRNGSRRGEHSSNEVYASRRGRSGGDNDDISFTFNVH